MFLCEMKQKRKCPNSSDSTLTFRKKSFVHITGNPLFKSIFGRNYPVRIAGRIRLLWGEVDWRHFLVTEKDKGSA